MDFPTPRTTPETAVPLCVDLDGTVIATDLLAESLLGFLKASPWKLPLAGWWLLGGRANLKRKLAQRVPIAAKSLPYDAEVLEFLKEQKSAGRRLFLATASDAGYAEAVAAHLGLFDGVIASDGAHNLSGPSKRDALARRFPGGFDYAGDSAKDLPVWRAARRAVVVRASPGLAAVVGSQTRVERVFPGRGGLLRAVLAAVRPHQWSKNLLIFVPLITSHEIGLNEATLRALQAAAAFSLCASSVYLLNDLVDLAHDRAHPAKKARPFASGALPLSWGPGLIAGLLGAAALVGWGLPATFWLVVLCYLALTLAYSLRVKEIMMLDVLCLAALYTLRILCGHAVADIPLSPWLLAFSMFVFLSLALLKRYSEVSRLAPGAWVGGRGYRGSDFPVLLQMGLSTGYLSVLVFALYINSDQVVRLYRQPVLLWIVCLVIFYAISRLWLLAFRGQIDEDPVLFSLKDGPAYACAAIALAALVAASRL